MAKKKRKATPGAGRKWFDGKREQDVLTKLYECWACDSTDSEAAFFAEVSTASLSRYLTAHPAIAERKAALKERPILLARRAIIGKFDGHMVKTEKGTGKKKRIVMVPAPIDADLALRYAERKRKAEFAPRSEVSGPGGAPLNPGPDLSDIPLDKLKQIKAIYQSAKKDVRK